MYLNISTSLVLGKWKAQAEQQQKNNKFFK